MASLKFYIKLSRPINLIIVGLTMLFFRQIILAKYINLQFSNTDFGLFILTTMIVTASGFVINDVFDIDIDKINKGASIIIKNEVQKIKANIYYYLLIFMGAIPTLFLANKYDHFDYAILYPFVIVLLWLYAKTWKKQLLIGNLIVASLSASVALLVFLSENETISMSSKGDKIGYIFTFYTLFAFLSSLAREIIKDIEDIEGDRQNNCKTLPIIYGIKTTEKFVILINLILTIIISYFCFDYFNGDKTGIYYAILALILPLIYITFLLVKTSSDFAQLSRYYKGLMLSGLVFLLFL